MSNVFWAKLYCKISGLFASFCWLWDFLLENLKLKRNFDDVRWNVWMNIKKLYAQNNMFKKRIPNMIFWVIYILAQISILGTALGRFSQFFFNFRRRPTMVADIFSQPLHHKKASYGPEIAHMYLQQRKLNTKNVIEWGSPCHFETEIIKEIFSFINLTFVTRKWQNKSALIELLTQSEFLYSFNLELVTRKQKNGSLTI